MGGRSGRNGGTQGGRAKKGAPARCKCERYARINQSGSHRAAWGMRARGVSERQRPPSKRSQRRQLRSQQARRSAQAKCTPPPCTAETKRNASAGERPTPTHLDDLTRLIVDNGGPLLVPQHRHGEAATIVGRRLAVQLRHVVEAKEGLRLAPAAVVARLARRVHKVPAVLAHVRVHHHGGDGRLEALERPRNQRPVCPRTRHGHVPNGVNTDGRGRGGGKRGGAKQADAERPTRPNKARKKKTTQRAGGGHRPESEEGENVERPPACQCPAISQRTHATTDSETKGAASRHNARGQRQQQTDHPPQVHARHGSTHTATHPTSHPPPRTSLPPLALPRHYPLSSPPPPQHPHRRSRHVQDVAPRRGRKRGRPVRPHPLPKRRRLADKLAPPRHVHHAVANGGAGARRRRRR